MLYLNIMVAADSSSSGGEGHGRDVGQGKSGQIMQVEERAKGTVANSVFIYYVAQVGQALVVAVLLLYVVPPPFHCTIEVCLLKDPEIESQCFHHLPGRLQFSIQISYGF